MSVPAPLVLGKARVVESGDTHEQLLGQYGERAVVASVLPAGRAEHTCRCSVLPLRLHVYRSLWGVRFSLVGTGSVLCGISILCLYVRLCVRVCVGAARPSPVQLYCSVDLHSKLYMLVFTFCFSNKIPWSTSSLVPSAFFIVWGRPSGP